MGRGKPKILVDGLDTYNYGGIEAYLCAVLPKLTDRFDFTVLVFSEPDERYGDLRIDGIRFAKIRRRRESPKGNRSDLEKIVTEGEYDVVWLHRDSLSNIALLTVAADKTDAAIVMHAHRASFKNFSKIRALLHRLNMSRANKLITLRIACSEGAGLLFYGQRHFLVLNNPVDVDACAYSPTARRAVRSELGCIGKRVVGVVARLDPVKNIKLLLEAMPIGLKEEPDLHLLIVGDGPLRNRLERKAASLGITDHVQFLGSRSDVPSILSAMDVFALPSFTEAFSIASIEAAASGLQYIVHASLRGAVPDTSGIRICSSYKASDWARAMVDCVGVCASELPLQRLQPDLSSYDSETVAEAAAAALVAASSMKVGG